MSLIGLMERVQHVFGRSPTQTPEPSPLNRAQRRDLARVKPGELRMRRERTFIAQSKRRKSSAGDHGAKSRRAFIAGVRKGTQWTHVQIKQAYAVGLQEGRKQIAWWVVPQSWFKRKKAAA